MEGTLMDNAGGQHESVDSSQSTGLVEPPTDTGSGRQAPSSESTHPADGEVAGMHGASAPSPAEASEPIVPSAIRSRPQASVLGRIRAFFWQDEQLVRARTAEYRPGDPGWAEFEAAHDALTQAEQLFESGGRRSPALLLYCSALRLLVKAYQARRGTPANRGVQASDWASFVASPPGSNLAAALSVGEQELVASVVAPDGESHLVGLYSDEALVCLRVLRKVARELDRSLEQDARGVWRVLRGRVTRIGLAVLILGIAAWVVDSKVNEKPNLALHRQVTVSGQHPTFKQNPAQLVDGDTTNMGFHGDGKPNSNAVVDLGSVQPLSKIVVYNRFECCHERSVPMLIEVSADGKSYQRITEQKEPFAKAEFDVPKISARYVRLTLLRVDSFHLAEVEVY